LARDYDIEISLRFVLDFVFSPNQKKTKYKGFKNIGLISSNGMFWGPFGAIFQPPGPSELGIRLCEAACLEFTMEMSDFRRWDIVRWRVVPVQFGVGTADG
jgi:hypothetical protein